MSCTLDTLPYLNMKLYIILYYYCLIHKFSFLSTKFHLFGNIILISMQISENNTKKMYLLSRSTFKLFYMQMVIDTFTKANTKDS